LGFRDDVEWCAEPFGQGDGVALLDPQMAVDDSKMTAEVMVAA
jgi:hypothetical protein